jgi:CDP-glucose 4,6-dehydratase
MAAQSLVRKSYENPIETFTTNILGTVNIFEAVRKIGNPGVVLNITSDKCYENTGKTSGYIESDPIGGYDPYSSSKGCSELITSSYRNSFFNSKQNINKILIASARAGNVIGGGDWSEDRLIPDIIKGILKNQKIKIRNPNSIRPWQFVLEPLYGYLLLIEKLAENSTKFDQSWNFGPNEKESKSVLFLIKKLTEQWGEQIQVEYESSDIHEENILMLNSHKARSNLRWKSKMNLEVSIKWTVEWYKKYQEGKDMRKVTEQQIEKYCNID